MGTETKEKWINLMVVLPYVGQDGKQLMQEIVYRAAKEVMHSVGGGMLVPFALGFEIPPGETRLKREDVAVMVVGTAESGVPVLVEALEKMRVTLNQRSLAVTKIGELSFLTGGKA